ncbi:hypothetical protein C8N44_10836 [Allosediminivita pacifica]|uniref:Uncharacterized protein n=1 Tax=Allosediminivita pacifica TaxID=1267769 RepID=A0A2T6AY69_9RHOB|nr:hypothetical protein C8N44_10836 [Allosediminivita pacifica]
MIVGAAPRMAAQDTGAFLRFPNGKPNSQKALCLKRVSASVTTVPPRSTHAQSHPRASRYRFVRPGSPSLARDQDTPVRKDSGSQEDPVK